jgi:CheY-like chemotaxis protein
MPAGGKLILQTGNVMLDADHVRLDADVRPGPYVLIAVSDSGDGIPADVRDKVFEPFFTTKGVGEGTGLGLSMVYGFVKQSGGHITLYSEVGHGTTVKLYLPRSADRASDIAPEGAAPVIGGSETILVVEDDDLVRDHVVAQLRGLGYATWSAGSGGDALALVEAGIPFDLLFTDVALPGGMNGRRLAEEVTRRRPSVKVLYSSGFTENAIVHHGRLDAGVALLAKPYRRADLARKIREMLDRRPGSSAG